MKTVNSIWLSAIQISSRYTQKIHLPAHIHTYIMLIFVFVLLKTLANYLKSISSIGLLLRVCNRVYIAGSYSGYFRNAELVTLETKTKAVYFLFCFGLTLCLKFKVNDPFFKNVNQNNKKELHGFNKITFRPNT